MGRRKTWTQQATDAIDALASDPANKGYGKKATGVHATNHAYIVTLGRGPVTIEGQYEVQPNLTDMMDEEIERRGR